MQDKDVVRRADVGAWVTLRLMPDVGKKRQGTSMLLDVSKRMDNDVAIIFWWTGTRGRSFSVTTEKGLDKI
jgi:hypothetical protein